VLKLRINISDLPELNSIHIPGKFSPYQVNGVLLIRIPVYEFYCAYDDLNELFCYVGKNNIKGSLDDHEINPVKFLLQIRNSISSCVYQREKADQDHCNYIGDNRCCGCRLITNILLYNSGTGNYQKSRKYWYNYGKFNKMGEWEINKDEIYNRVIDYAKKNLLELCPHFCRETIRDFIYKDLPDVILLDNYNYRLHYTETYEKGKRVLKAVNISLEKLNPSSSGVDLGPAEI